jgi:hypothetical protein
MVPVIVAALAMLGVARPSSAIFHATVIDEVATSYNGDPTVQFVEMRMLSGLQNFVQNSVFAAFDANGNYINDLLVVPGTVPNSGAGVRWLIGTSAFQTASGVVPDFVIPSGILPTGGGMLCYGGGPGGPNRIAPALPNSWIHADLSNYVDCVAYGTYAGSTNALIGTPTPLDGDGHSLQRLGTAPSPTVPQNNAVDYGCGDPLTPENNVPGPGHSASLPATTQCPACAVAPNSSCTDSFAKGGLQVSEATGKQKLQVKLIGGPALMQTDFGNPLAMSGTAYKLCIYDNMSNLVGHLVLDQAGATCGGNPCWAALGGDPPTGKGYKYKDSAQSVAGISLVLLKGGSAGKSKVLLKGSGSGLPTGITAGLQNATSALVQLIESDAPQCVAITLNDIKKQEADSFKAKK